MIQGRKRGYRDLALAAVVLLIAGIGWMVNHYREQGPATMVEISVDGKIVETLDLGQDTEMTVRGYGGGTNHLIIRDGEAWIDDATCPDKLCIHQGRIRQNSEMLVCLPNLVIVQIREGN